VGRLKFKIEEPGVFLKEKRKQAKFTLKQVSEHTDLSIGYISRIENGSSTPSLETLYKLSTLLSFKVEDICSFEEISLHTGEPVAIEDLFKAFPILIGEDVLSDLEKFQMAKLLHVIHNMDWKDEINKMNHISQILLLIDQMKKGES
jgi:transcriptional regulator with XRE-family HTH domain